MVEIATHGEPAGEGRRGAARAGAYVILGHSHNPTPPFWRRMWLRLRGKWPRRYYVAGYSLPSIKYENPTAWAHGQVLAYRQGVGRQIHLDFETYSAEPLKQYCAADVEAERRLHIVFTQPAARFDETGSLVYDSWYWTGRSK